MTEPLVSVVITAYQAARWLPATLGSVMAQTYRNWEVVLIDDGSTDDTVDRIAPFRSRIRYVHQPNAGMAAARNAGLALAGGDYIALLDADDLWLPEKLATQVRIARANPESGLIVCDGVLFDDATGKELRAHLIRDASLLEATVTLRCHESMIRVNPVACPAQTLIPRPVLERVGPLGDYQSQDYDCWLRISQHYPLTFHADRLVRRRKHPTSMTGPSGAPRYAQAVQRVKIWSAHRERCDAEERALVDARRRSVMRRTSKGLVKYGITRDRRAARRWLAELARADPWSPFPRAGLLLLRVLPSRSAPAGQRAAP